jgi:hypothetical protein
VDEEVHYQKGRTQTSAALLLVVGNWGQFGVIAHTLCWGHGAAVPMNSGSLGAGGTGFVPAPCGCEVRLAQPTSVRPRPPNLNFTGFRGTQCRLVSTGVVVGCCQYCCQLGSGFLKNSPVLPPTSGARPTVESRGWTIELTAACRP